MNTVGKPGKLGEQIRCVVSVSMLTEGWDASTVTHVLGIRAFGTQLLGEQVVGRALRRMSYAPNHEAKFEPEYADVYGVPFSFLPCSGTTKTPKPGPTPTRVHALAERISREITWPRLVGYRYELPGERLTAKFTSDAKLVLTNADIPTKTDVGGIVGAIRVDTLDPYSINNVEHQYYPDFLVRIEDGHGKEDALNLILEVTGERKKEKEAKTATARTLWVPAVNNHGGFGRWAFLGITDPYDDVVELIRSSLNQGSVFV